MINRKIVLNTLEGIHLEYQGLKDLVDNASDQELENILAGSFEMFGCNICVNFMFMRMIISREEENAITETDNQQNMSNEALDKYFEDNWNWVVSDML